MSDIEVLSADELLDESFEGDGARGLDPFDLLDGLVLDVIWVSSDTVVLLSLVRVCLVLCESGFFFPPCFLVLLTLRGGNSSISVKLMVVGMLRRRLLQLLRFEVLETFCSIVDSSVRLSARKLARTSA